MSKNFRELIDEYEIVIPLIQRDYAQGRTNENLKANKFLNAIKDGVIDGLNLDFIYGKTDNNIFIPLDGQQRLTTLFLLHWYASLESHYIANLSKFSYEVRSSTKDFIKDLTTQTNWEKLTKRDIKSSIENSNWFFLSWKNDPTVVALLHMLDLIETLFQDTQIEQFNSITFELLKLEKFNLTDELYVKMNARGKPLTEFENFKAEFEKYIEDDKIKANLDNRWLDLFWSLGQEDAPNIKDAPKLADDMFYNFFYNVTFNFYLEELEKQDKEKKRILLECNINNQEKEFKTIDDFIKECSIFDFYKKVYSKKENVEKVILILDNLSVEETFKKFVTKKEISQHERVRFYALSLGYWNKLDEKELTRWKRVSFNLINNQLIQSPDDLIRSIKSLHTLIQNSQKDIYHYIKDNRKGINYFSALQREEESLKAELIENDIIWEKELERAEKIFYLKGQIGFLLEYSKNKIDSFIEYRDKFEALWKFGEKEYNNQITIYQALLTKGDYLPKVGNSGNYTFCSFDEKSIRIKNDNWRKVFNSNKLKSTEDNPNRNLYLKDLLDDKRFVTTDVEKSLDKIISEYPFQENDPLSFFIKNQSYIRYCKKLQVRWYDKNQIYLLKTTQMNGTHAELYTYDLYTKKIKDKLSKPFHKPKYIETNTWDLPSIRYENWIYNDKNIILDVKYTNNNFCIHVFVDNGILPENIVHALQSIGFDKECKKSDIAYADIEKEIELCYNNWHILYIK